MEEQDVRGQAEAFCASLVTGDMERATADFSPELRRNLGEVIALLPLPASDATIETVDRGGSGYTVVVRLVGETDENRVQTRWKERDGRPTIVELSHLSRTERAAERGEPAGETEPEAGQVG